MPDTFDLLGAEMAFDRVRASATPGPMRRVCVYCGASPGTDPAYAEAARALGTGLAAAGLELVYGGGTDGLMGIVAQSVLAHGGRVTGIIPSFLTHQCRTVLSGAHELIVVEHMHARKQAMFDMADAMVALPGGLGTLEELVEQMTWVKLGRHTKPLIIADIGGFWHPLLKLVEHMEFCSFLGAAWQAPYQVCRSVEDILMALQDRSDATGGVDDVRRQRDCEVTTLLVEGAEITGRALTTSRHDVLFA